MRTRAKSSRSLSSSAAFETFVLDQLADLGDVLARKMFGGVGLYCDGVFFGIIARDVLYLKVDAHTRELYRSAGSDAFRPYPNRPESTQYFAVPVEVLESGPELVRWARDAVSVGRQKERQRVAAKTRKS